MVGSTRGYGPPENLLPRPYVKVCCAQPSWKPASWLGMLELDSCFAFIFPLSAISFCIAGGERLNYVPSNSYKLATQLLYSIATFFDVD